MLVIAYSCEGTWLYNMSLTHCSGIHAEDLLQETVKLLHVLESNRGRHTATISQGAVYLLSEFLDEFGERSKGIKPEEKERKKRVD